MQSNQYINIEVHPSLLETRPNIQMLPSEYTKQEKSNIIDGFNRKQSEASTVSSLTLFEEVDDKLLYFSTDDTEGDGVIFDNEGKILGNDMDNCLNASITASSNQVTDLDEGTSSNATTTNQVTIVYVSIVYKMFCIYSI